MKADLDSFEVKPGSCIVFGHRFKLSVVKALEWIMGTFMKARFYCVEDERIHCFKGLEPSFAFSPSPISSNTKIPSLMKGIIGR